LARGRVNAVFLLALREIEEKKNSFAPLFRYCCNRVLKTPVNDEKEKEERKKGDIAT